MIRNEDEYQEASRRLDENRHFAERRVLMLGEQGLSAQEIQRAMEPLLTFQSQLRAEVTWYERVRRGDVGMIGRLAELGRLLIALRIAGGVTQRQLAERLGVTETQVSRGERNEYHAISVERAQRILDALGVTLTVGVQERARGTRKPTAAGSG
jgi:DNA-binding XRE family transcriptional regulator